MLLMPTCGRAHFLVRRVIPETTNQRWAVGEDVLEELAALQCAVPHVLPGE